MKSFLNKYINYLLFTLFFFVLFLSYTINLWKTSSDFDFKNHDVYDESFVIGRLVRSEKEGIFSYAGFPGRNSYIIKTKNGLDSVPDLAKQCYAQYHYYFIPDFPIPEYFESYKSQPGGQILIYSILQKILPFSPQNSIKIYRAINAFFFILCILLFLDWTRRNYNYTSAFILFIFIALSPWINNFAHNLWWAFASFYIPFICILLVSERQSKFPYKITSKKLFLILYLVFLIKGFLTGFEFITTTIIASVCPLIYYHFLNKKKISELINVLLKSALSVSLAILTNLILLLIQLRSFFGSFSESINYIIYSLIKRTTFNTPGSESILQEPNLSDILTTYMNGNAFKWRFINLQFEFKFYYFILLLIFCSIIILYINKKISTELQRKNKALLITTYFSIVAPFSWFIIFKQHAYIHPFLDYIVWYIPFLLFVFLVVGQTIYLTTKLLCDKRSKKVII